MKSYHFMRQLLLLIPSSSLLKENGLREGSINILQKDFIFPLIGDRYTDYGDEINNIFMNYRFKNKLINNFVFDDSITLTEERAFGTVDGYFFFEGSDRRIYFSPYEENANFEEIAVDFNAFLDALIVVAEYSSKIIEEKIDTQDIKVKNDYRVKFASAAGNVKRYERVADILI